MEKSNKNAKTNALAYIGPALCTDKWCQRLIFYGSLSMIFKIHMYIQYTYAYTNTYLYILILGESEGE